MTALDLFSGIGGITLGLERAGIRTVMMCEIDKKCRRVLTKHWPNVPIHDDVRTLPLDQCRGVDLVCGGFPCQDLSTSGKMRGLNAEKSGLWWEMRRIVGELRPRYVLVENVRALLSPRRPWFGTFLRSLAEIGYDAEWSCIPAPYVGACHPRDRIFVVAYPAERRREQGQDRVFQSGFHFPRRIHHRQAEVDRVVTAKRRAYAPPGTPIRHDDDGLSRFVDGLRQLGNAVVPQISEAIGTAIMRHAHG